MKKGNRKHVRLLAMAMSLAVVGMLAAFIALAAQPAPASAQDLCDGPLAPLLPQCLDGSTPPPPPTGPGTTPPPPTDGTDLPAGAMLESSSDTSSAGVKLTLTIELDRNLTGSSWVEIYLEDDYQEPGSIAKENVIFEIQGTNPAETNPPSNPTLNTTFAAAAVEIDDGGEIDGEGDAVVISARIPDMRSGDETGYPLAGQTLRMVVSKAAGIENPSEQGSHSTGFSIIGGTDDRADEAGMKLDDLPTLGQNHPRR